MPRARAGSTGPTLLRERRSADGGLGDGRGRRPRSARDRVRSHLAGGPGEVIPRYGPLAGVAGTSDQSGPWDHVGASRILNLSDGTSVREELTAYAEGERFAYRLLPVKTPMRLLVNYAAGAWEFTDAGEDTTHVRWTVTFHPRRGRRWLIRALLAPLWERYQRQALALAVREAEQG
jgi:hypothetical protein